MAAQRHPRLLLRLHSVRDELFALLSWALEAHTLLRHGASFSEHFYFLRRHHAESRSHSSGWARAYSERLKALPAHTRLLLEIAVLVCGPVPSPPTA